MYKATLALLTIAQLSLSAPIAPRQDAPCAGLVNGPGICLKNAASVEQTISFFQNTNKGNGYGDPAKDAVPGLDTVVAAGASAWVPLDLAFKGRVQRTKFYPSTWAEFQIQDTLTENHTPDYKAHGDISLIQGYDGAVEIASFDDGGAHNGFSQDLMVDAVPEAIYTRPDDQKVVLGNTEFSAMAWLQPNLAAQQHEEAVLPPGVAYTRANSAVGDVSGAKNALLFTFY